MNHAFIHDSPIQTLCAACLCWVQRSTLSVITKETRIHSNASRIWMILSSESWSDFSELKQIYERPAGCLWIMKEVHRIHMHTRTCKCTHTHTRMHGHTHRYNFLLKSTNIKTDYKFILYINIFLRYSYKKPADDLSSKRDCESTFSQVTNKKMDSKPSKQSEHRESITTSNQARV